MLGQSFAPLGNDPMQQRPSGPSGPAGAQEAIKILNLRMPRVQGAGAPAPQALLQGAGSAGLPQQQNNPIIQAILQAVLGHFQPQQQSAPSAMGGMQGPAPQMPTPNIQYQPLPGGTAGPGPGPSPMQRDRQMPMPGGKMNSFDFKR